MVDVEIDERTLAMAVRLGLAEWDEEQQVHVATALGIKAINDYLDGRLGHLNLLDGYDDADS